jgi:CHAT domain-containing protein
MKKLLFVPLFIFSVLFSFSQFDAGSLKNKLKEKSIEAKDKLKGDAKDKLASSLDNSRKEFDESNFNYAISFIDNSGTFENQEKGSNVGQTISNAKKYYEGSDVPPEDKAYAHNRNGELFMATNKFRLAESNFKSAKFFYETGGTKSGLNYSHVISNLALLYQSTGRYTKAKLFADEALALRKDLGQKTMYAVSLNNKGVLEKDLGEYTRAEKYFNEALGILKEANDELGQALVHNNLAMTHADMAKLNVAETDMQSCMEHAAKILKDNSSNFIKLQINQANILRLQKKYNEAEKLYLAAIAIKEKKLGAHPDLAHLKRGLAGLYMEMGKTADVEKLLFSAVDIDKRKLGDNHPSTLSAMQDLGNFYRYIDQPGNSLGYLKTVAEKKKTIYGEKHPNYIRSLEDLALTQWQSNQITEAKLNYQQVIDNTQQYIHTFFNSLNENEKTLYWEKTNSLLHRYYSFVLANYKTEPELLSSLYNTLVNTKGFLLNTSSKIRNAIATSGDAELQQVYTNWLETKEQLNTAYQLSKQELLEEKINVDSLESKANDYERILSQKSALFNESKSSPVNFESISKTLAADEAAAEILEINEYINGFTGKGKYIALVVKAGKAALVEIADSKLIQETVETFRNKTINRKPENEAYAIVWKALDAELNGVKKLYLSLDGLYHQLSINALKDASGAYLIDKYSISFLGNTKDIIEVKQKAAAAKKPASAFLIGNPAYGSGGVVAQLPGTEAEVNNIKKILNASQVQNTVLIGSKATETEVKNVKSPSILHIATHGYFLADLSEVEVNKVLGVDVNVARQNPLLRSGVLLANCENVFDENYRPTTGDNGILTAYEALSLNLDKTDLVVLSACETGLGSVKQGEGVFGLQRSFLIAGANSIIMSLWSVSDAATMELMTLFYSNYSKTGNKQQAFVDAQKQLKTKYKEPFFWAAFVMLNK